MLCLIGQQYGGSDRERGGDGDGASQVNGNRAEEVLLSKAN